MVTPSRVHCTRCNSINTTVHESFELYKYNKQKFRVLTLYTTCDNCSHEFIPMEQILENERRLIEAKKDLK